MTYLQSVAGLLTLLLASTSYSATTNRPLTLATVEQAIIEAESQFDDVISGTERSIEWHDGIAQTDIAIIYLHGFSASKQELAPTVSLLADRLNANIYYARLSGHGRSSDAMKEGSIKRWLQDTRQAYEIGTLIGKKVVVLSTSTGGTLATWLITQPFAKELLTNVMVSPNFGVNNKLGAIVKWQWGLSLIKTLKGPYYSFEPMNDIHKAFWTERYPFESLVPMFELLDLVNELDKSHVSAPQLVIYSPNDQVIDPSKIVETASQFVHSKITLLAFNESTDPHQHVLAGDACSPESTDKMVDLIANYVASLID